MRWTEITAALVAYAVVMGAAYAYPGYRASSVASARAAAVAECRTIVDRYHDAKRAGFLSNKVVEDAFRCGREVLVKR